ncbi:unnamed protein product [Spodoptera littoralis]|uniref:Uncharacterized protein n=1 Tax=Spodoptera littoralis TaxID=7109 RepID=A0A9P0N422_SPOLI|nr:unnamed protein product [Spodoptera littoralis]CAH1643982.1 unnamed protein product [Spodoptera littoralis]
MFLLRPVLFSLADTLRMPFASRSNVTSILGTSQVERAQQVVVLGHRSLALVHLDRDRRLVVRVRGERLRLLARDLTVALDDLRHHAAGGFDASNTSWIFESCSPLRMAAWTAAPYATASSGLMDRFSFLPQKKFCSRLCTFGILVEPPTRTTSWIWLLSILASLSAFSTGSRVPRNRSALSSSKRARVTRV